MVTVVDLNFFIVLVVGELQGLLAKFTVHENTINSLIRSASFSTVVIGSLGNEITLSRWVICPTDKSNG
jgi:hypothetical protein